MRLAKAVILIILLDNLPTKRNEQSWVIFSTSKQSEIAPRSYPYGEIAGGTFIRLCSLVAKNKTRRMTACFCMSIIIKQFFVMIKHSSDTEVKILPYTAPASTAFDFNDVVCLNTSGQLAKATSETPRSEIIGLIQCDILSTDANYASTKTVPVLVATEVDEFDADVSTGTAVSTMVGKRVDLDDEDSVNVNGATQKVFGITKIISTSKVRGKFVNSGDKMRLVSYQETITRASFTDGGSTAGTYNLKTSIPAGAVFERSLVSGVTGFIGDTSAVLTIGDGTNVDRYNTGTPSVFTTAAAGVDAGIPSGTLFHSATKTPRLTVTSDSDFTAVSAGALTVTLFWYEAE